MQPLELRVTLKLAGIGQRQLARILGVEVSTVQRWVTGTRPIPQYLVAYLELYRENQRLTSGRDPK